MAKNRYVNTAFWDDPFIVELATDEKLLFLYLLTSPLVDICGAYQITVKRIAFDTGISVDRITEILELLQGAGKISYERGWMIVENFVKHQSLNPKVKLGIVNSYRRCPDWIQAKLSDAYHSLSIAHDWLPIPQPESEPDLELELETNPSREPPAQLAPRRNRTDKARVQEGPSSDSARFYEEYDEFIA